MNGSTGHKFTSVTCNWAKSRAFAPERLCEAEIIIDTPASLCVFLSSLCNRCGSEASSPIPIPLRKQISSKCCAKNRFPVPLIAVPLRSAWKLFRFALGLIAWRWGQAAVGVIFPATLPCQHLLDWNLESSISVHWTKKDSRSIDDIWWFYGVVWGVNSATRIQWEATASAVFFFPALYLHVSKGDVYKKENELS